MTGGTPMLRLGIYGLDFYGFHEHDMARFRLHAVEDLPIPFLLPLFGLLPTAKFHQDHIPIRSGSPDHPKMANVIHTRLTDKP